MKPFLTNPKCRVFLSGHAHAYEHFRRQGKDFLVFGGAGGLLHPLKSAEERQFADISTVADSSRFFHYLECSIGPEGVRFSIHMLRRDMSGFDVVDPFTASIAR